MGIILTKDIYRALQRGDHDAFNELFIEYEPRIRAFITGFIKSADDAEELTHDIFMSLWINHAKINPEQSLNSYMFKMAKNAAFRYIEKKNSEKKYIANELHVRDGFTYTAEEQFRANELKIMIRAKLSQMPKSQQTVFRMSREEGLSNDEIAEKLNISKETVRSHLYLALKELQKIIPTVLIVAKILS